MESLNLNCSIESNGLEFQGYSSKPILRVSPALILKPLNFEVGLQIRNNTAFPVHFKLYDNLEIKISYDNGTEIERLSLAIGLGQLRHFDFYLIQSGDVLTYALPAKLFVQGYSMPGDSWLSRFSRVISHKLLWFIFVKRDSKPFCMSISFRDKSTSIFQGFAKGNYSVQITYNNTASSATGNSEIAQRANQLENVWVGSITVPTFPISIS